MKLTTVLALCLSLALASAAYAQSNAAPSLRIGLNPCQLFSGALAANTQQHVDVRSVCNVPDGATAVDVAVTVAAGGSGTLKLWEYDGSEPASPAASYSAGTISTFAIPRLCAPWGECFHDISLKASSTATVTLVLQGYYFPVE